MNKLIITGVALFGACAAFATELTPEEIARVRAMRAELVAKKGGMVTKPQSGNTIRVISAQKVLPLDFIRTVISEMDGGLGMPVEVSAGSVGKCPLEAAEKAVKQPKTAAVLLVVEDAKLPMVLSAPENAWAILNVKKLDDDFPPKKVYDLRARKELYRAFAAAFGAGTSINSPSIMDPVYSKSDLDALRSRAFNPEVLAKIQIAAKMRGVEPVRHATYKQAAIEGWAPAPTNDVQRAIMEEVKNPSDKFKKDFPEFGGKQK